MKLPSLPFFLAAVLASSAHAAAGPPAATPPTPLLQCSSLFAVDQFVCATNSLRDSLGRIENYYSKASQNTDFNIRFLASKDRKFFDLRLNNCNNAPAGQTPRQTPESCATWVIEEKDHALAQPITMELLVAQISNSGFLDTETVERFPNIFSGIDASFAGTILLKKINDTTLAGTFTDNDTNKTFPAVMPNAKPGAFTFYAAHPSIFSWFSAHMERRAGVMTIIISDNSIG